MELEEAAHRLHVDPQKLKSWESGAETPTVAQLRKIAHIYKQSFAAFYLPAPPDVFTPPTRDYRLLPDELRGEISSAIAQEMRLAIERREICLELLAEKEEEPVAFGFRTSFQENPETVGGKLRSLLGITREQQQSWHNARIGFNKWRSALESRGVLVFQAVDVNMSEMRGFSVADFPLPVIVVNRKDSPAGRSFSMLHELAHLALRSSGLCDLELGPEQTKEDRDAEVFCNHVAGSALVPKELLLKEPEVENEAGPEWDDDILESLSRRYSVSREVVLRRLLILELTTPEFYEQKRKEYLRRYRLQSKQARQRGFLLPAPNVISSAGRLYTATVLDALHNGRITTSDASDFFGIRTKHFDQLSVLLSAG